LKEEIGKKNSTQLNLSQQTKLVTQVINIIGLKKYLINYFSFNYTTIKRMRIFLYGVFFFKKKNHDKHVGLR
jgi:hypothetical protein